MRFDRRPVGRGQRGRLNFAGQESSALVLDGHDAERLDHTQHPRQIGVIHFARQPVREKPVQNTIEYCLIVRGQLDQCAAGREVIVIYDFLAFGAVLPFESDEIRADTFPRVRSLPITW